MYIPKEQVKTMTNTTKNNSNSIAESNSTKGSEQNSPRGADIKRTGDTIQITAETVSISGVLEVLPDYGVIRQETPSNGNEELPKDVYISQSQIKKFNLRVGDVITGLARLPKEGERYLSLLKIETVAGVDPKDARYRPDFDKLVPIFPDEWMQLETTKDILSTRIIDLVSPIGKGQRAMIVAPPKAGKTWILKDIANGISQNYPEVVVMVALIGERPEEVTHFSRSVKGEVYSSNFDQMAEHQTKIAEMCLERSKRLAEAGADVVILMDSLTRLARAYNMVVAPSGRTLSGGLDPSSLYPAKHFFGAARNFENGGSLTIIATSLVETGSRMDDVIFEEFKGTGNMELRLDRSLAERRIYPAIDIKASGTRHEEHLYDDKTFESVVKMRRMIDLLDERDATPLVIDRLKKTKSNDEFLKTLHEAR
ncbi:MAG TPA: transcription termination factor Rho [candidate division WWE3 bacterium]|uniref:Transcription termination factor Rho n=1 Tax=candidate division WWE3 bacterium TaxID=2053526 RepID=A0A7C1HIX1_UNCKA|nr:transcription termination factor Rho [candidate division WWE3 bacterium]